MAEGWSPHDLQVIDAAHELLIAVRRTDGTLRRWTPIWVVSADGGVYVRTWYRRDTGWFGHALRSGSARIRVPGLEADVAVEDVGEGPAGLHELVDTAYGDKYGRSASTSMVGAAAVATTLQLTPNRREPELLARRTALPGGAEGCAGPAPESGTRLQAARSRRGPPYGHHRPGKRLPIAGGGQDPGGSEVDYAHGSGQRSH